MPFQLHFKGLHLSFKRVMLRNGFSFKTSLVGYWEILNLLWSEPCRVMFVYGGKIQNIKKKCSENFIEYFSHSKNEMAKCVNTKFFFRGFRRPSAIK